ncbi:OLC1v1024287C1 [Oldenlandia corymbosa var. corymbosa]|uniref:OLC1v1024287C1 n=1 Tax=Oldenlandia corymbosa var. corymbosa TaxID=529605 RepID=A0AAV1C1V4_OLDCO|nr:OLC1v1024287C1 [Oldenlandia corymbosa var. corymbosa]
MKLKQQKLRTGKSRKKPESSETENVINKGNIKETGFQSPKIIPSKKQSKSLQQQFLLSQFGSLNVAATTTTKENVEDHQGKQQQKKQILGQILQQPDSSSVDHQAGKQPLFAFTDLICKKILRKTGTYFKKWKRARRKDANCTNAELTKNQAAESGVRNLRKDSSCRRNDEVTDHQEADSELCKKKILMGEKCRPLTKSGTLHYDETGVILAEET